MDCLVFPISYAEPLYIEIILVREQDVSGTVEY